MIDDNDMILANIDVSQIDPEAFYESDTRANLDIVIKLAFAPSCGNTHRVFQQIPKHLRTRFTRPIPIGWAKIVERNPRFHDDERTKTY